MSDLISIQKKRLDTMFLSEDELAMLSRARKNIGVLGGGGALLGGLGGFFMTKGNGSGGLLRIFVIGSTLFAGGCLGFGLGIQSALETISRQPGKLAEEVRKYQELIGRARKAGGRDTLSDGQDREFEAHLAKGT